MTIRMTVHLLSLVILLTACSVAMQQPARVVESTKKHRQCETCHVSSTPVAGDPLVLENGDPASLCERCHQQQAVDHHPVDFNPTETYYVTPSKVFPLQKGTLRCITCHDEHAGTGYVRVSEPCGASLTTPPNFLRGGLKFDLRNFCFQCHFQERYAEIDPHIMLDDNGQIVLVNGKPVCLLCHAVVPSTGETATGTPPLRADVSFLCLRCHPPMPGEFYKHHFGVKVSARTVRYMKASERNEVVILPLTRAGRTTCSTCHNPHQKEVALSAPARAGADSLYRLRIGKQDICNACHPAK